MASAEWAAANPILLPGEPGHIKNTGKVKIGDGLTHWNDLLGTSPWIQVFPGESIQDAINSISSGIVQVSPGTFDPFILKTGVYVVGSGESTIISAASGVDGIIAGLNNQNMSGLGAMNLSVSGGRYGLRLNNVQRGFFESLNLESQMDSIYCEGQIETSIFRRLCLNGFSSYGILTGQTNGGSSALSYNYPIIQKSEFDHIELRGASGATGIKITAGVIDAVQQTSGYSGFRHIVSQGQEVCSFYIDKSQNISISNFQNEQQTLPAANTYSVIKIGTGVGMVSLSDFQLAVRANDDTPYKYGIEQLDGFLTFKNSFIASVSGSGAGSADIYMAGIGGLIEQVSVLGGSTSGIVFQNTNVRDKTLLINVYDATNSLITDWTAGVAWIGSGLTSSMGVSMGQASFGNIYTKYIYPLTDDTYLVGVKSQAFKGVIVKDTTNGHYYRIETINGVVTATDLGT